MVVRCINFSTELYVESQGCNRQCDVSSCKVYLNGNSSNNLCVNERGHNVVVLNPKTSQTVSRNFDTHSGAVQVKTNCVTKTSTFFCLQKYNLLQVLP